MKKLFFLNLVLISVCNLKAQDVIRGHHGFYLSMGIGPVFGKISDDLSTDIMDMSGTGAVFDFKIGGAIKENLILHATLISNTMAGPTKTTWDNSSIKANDNLNVGEAMLGVGITYYVMPQHIFLSWNLGFGNFSIMDNSNSANDVSTKIGFSMQLKIGKE